MKWVFFPFTFHQVDLFEKSIKYYKQQVDFSRCSIFFRWLVSLYNIYLHQMLLSIGFIVGAAREQVQADEGLDEEN